MSKQSHYSIVIVGAGIAGLTLAALLAREKFSVAIVESKRPQLRWSKTSYNARVSTINTVSARIFKNLAIWPELRAQTITPLFRMHVWDYLNGVTIDFDCTDIAAEQLGFVVENREVVRALWQYLQQRDNVTFYCPQQPKQIVQMKDHIQLIFDKKIITAELIIGADGGHSWVREFMRAELQQRSYDQDAIVAVITSEKQHEQTAYQNFLPTGPLGVLPLSESHHAAIVWSANQEYAESLIEMNDKGFNRELTNALDEKLGFLQLLTERKKIPLIMRHAKHYVTERMALIGDAAHTLHPLAGQGANLSLMDAACLAQSLIDAQKMEQDIGGLRPLRRYERWRKGNNTFMIGMMDIFKELFASQSPYIVQLRGIGLKVTDRLQCMKNYFMHYAMGEMDDVPNVAR